jgi:hypothetical protein
VCTKSHGFLQGYLEVDADLPHELAQGLKAAYEAAKKFRAERNGRIIQEPWEIGPLPD